ncbi:MAG: FHA domain-containing protein, partial [Acidobacteriota bacterium]|nr:FHA domain-containing protein [Acidobacteriota bacterium]
EGPPPLGGAGAGGGGGAAVGRKTVLLSEKRKPPVVGWLVAVSGDQKGEDFRVRDGQNTIGSGAENDIVIHDTTVSGKHASIRYRDNKFFITDLDSTNGTHLNDSSEPIAREELKDNDLLRVGDVSLKFKCL